MRDKNEMVSINLINNTLKNIWRNFKLVSFSRNIYISIKFRKRKKLLGYRKSLILNLEINLPSLLVILQFNSFHKRFQKALERNWRVLIAMVNWILYDIYIYIRIRSTRILSTVGKHKTKHYYVKSWSRIPTLKLGDKTLKFLNLQKSGTNTINTTYDAYQLSVRSNHRRKLDIYPVIRIRSTSLTPLPFSSLV